VLVIAYALLSILRIKTHRTLAEWSGGRHSTVSARWISSISSSYSFPSNLPGRK
jgi:hypothetical protein